MNILKLFTMNQTEVNEYFRLRREERYNREGPRATHIPFHNFMHYIFIFALKALRLFEKRKVVVLADKRRDKGKRRTLYACSHVGGKDVESLFEAIHTPCYLLCGDPGPYYRSIDGLMLWLNGIISLETRNKTDRKIAKERVVSLLRQGGSLMMCPEGAWNITENEPMMKMFTGAAIMALESGADIVPLALEKYDDTYYAIIGEELHYSDFSEKDAKTLTAELRDILSTLKWDIWENFGVFPRKEQSAEAFHKHLHSLFNLVDGYTYQDVIETRFYDKTITSPEEAFAHLNTIQPTKQSAFLFNKRLK